MSSAIEPDLVEDSGDHAEQAGSRVIPVVPPPSDWLNENEDSVPDLRTPREATEEDVFWSTPPRYSLLVSLAPTPIAPKPAHQRIWSARLLFTTISCAIFTLLVLELRSVAKHESSRSTRATSVAVTHSP